MSQHEVRSLKCIGPSRSLIEWLAGDGCTCWRWFICGLSLLVGESLLGELPHGSAFEERAPRILVDAYHAHTWTETLPNMGLNEYHLLHSPARALTALRNFGWCIDLQLTPWSAESLKDCDAIFINLVSADLPPFRATELDAIESFVRSGGGLYLVVDHTNCYYHCHVLTGLVDRLGIELRSETLCDEKPHALGSGNAWVVFSDIRPHSVTDGIERIAFQTGGVLPKSSGVIFSSDNAWGDQGVIPPYGETNSPGFFGDFARQANEESGVLAAVAAMPFGDGRVFVIADQNSIGGMYLNYLDNRRLWFNAMHWLVQSPRSAQGRDTILAHSDAPEPGKTLLWCLEPNKLEDLRFGSDGADGYYRVFAWLNKVGDARGTQRPVPAKIMILPDERLLLYATSKSTVEQFLKCEDASLIILDSSMDSNGILEFGETNTWQHTDISPDRFNGEQESLNGEVLVQRTPQGSQVFWIRGHRFDNANYVSPESAETISPTVASDVLLRLLKSLGVQFTTSTTLGDEWLNELDE